MSIYTKKGDKGQTSLADGTVHGKREMIYEAIGIIDELNSWIGLCVAKILINTNKKNKNIREDTSQQKHDMCKNLQKIQNNLFAINSILARAKHIKFNIEKETRFLEKEIDKMEKELPRLQNFILPGGTEVAALLHVARAVTRRTERIMTRYFETSSHKTILHFLPYFNRLSDYLFTLARWINWKMEAKEIIWKKAK